MDEVLLLGLACLLLPLVSFVLFRRDDRGQVQFCLRCPKHMGMRHLGTGLGVEVKIAKGIAAQRTCVFIDEMSFSDLFIERRGESFPIDDQSGNGNGYLRVLESRW